MLPSLPDAGARTLRRSTCARVVSIEASVAYSLGIEVHDLPLELGDARNRERLVDLLGRAQPTELRPARPRR